MVQLQSSPPRPTITMWVGSLIIGSLLTARGEADESTSVEIRNYLADLTETIRELEKTANNNAFMREDLAISYNSRAKLYFARIENFVLAEEDFTRAIDLLTIAARDQPEEFTLQSALAEGHLFRARTRMKLKKLEPALLDSSAAIPFYRRLAERQSVYQSNPVYALKTRIEVARKIEDRSEIHERQLQKDLANAITLLEELCEDGINDRFYRKELGDLKAIQEKTRITRLDQNGENRTTPLSGPGQVVADQKASTGQNAAAAESPSAMQPQISDDQPVVKWEARSPSNLPFGSWINATDYRNDFGLPVKITLPGSWERSIPPGASFHVIRKDGMATVNPDLPLKPEDLDQGFVMWAESFVAGERVLLGLEIRGREKGTEFQDSVPKLIQAIIRNESETPETLYEPIARFHQVLIAGRLCWQLDLDVCKEGGSYSRRNIYVPGDDVLYDFGWAMTEPRSRAALDKEFDLMVQVGAPFQRTEEKDIQAQQILDAITKVQQDSKPLADLQKKLEDAVDIQGAAISRMHAFLYDRRGGSPFGIARRTGNNAGAIAARQTVQQMQESIDQLMAERLQLRRETILDSLPADQLVLAKLYYPDMFLESDREPPAGSMPSATEPTNDSNMATPQGGFDVGQSVDVLWEKTWYPATVRAVADGNRWRIRYDGYSAEWDETVTRDRIRARKPSEPKFRDFGPEQLIGPPNTEQAGDYATAWASRTPDESAEWILVEYDSAVQIEEIAIYETYHPGAVAKISVLDAAGRESVVWTSEETRPVSEAKRTLRVRVDDTVKAKLLKIEIDSRNVRNWNEIDTVGIQDQHGKWHWPIRADASSSYAAGQIDPQLKPRIPRHK